MSVTFIKIDSLQHLEILRQTYPTNLPVHFSLNLSHLLNVKHWQYSHWNVLLHVNFEILILWNAIPSVLRGKNLPKMFTKSIVISMLISICVTSRRSTRFYFIFRVVFERFLGFFFFLISVGRASRDPNNDKQRCHGTFRIVNLVVMTHVNF